uniref:Relaxin receptor 1-like n=1 Tax=Crassostrea virginica TaxID=6565 RepID=A0A8B8EPA0_CRAVI|nr:relaxin receptor 1-like [Crassostrea virginica]
MILFVGANFGIFIAILLGQLFIFVNLICVGKQINSNNTIQQRKEISLGKTLIAVAITDMSCWIPIGVIGLLTQAGYSVTAEMYTWIMIIVFPVHSALNPIIYIFSEILRHRQEYQMITSHERQTSTSKTPQT